MPFTLKYKEHGPLEYLEQCKEYERLSKRDKIEFLEMTKKRHCIECKFCAENGPPKEESGEIDETRIYLDKLCKKFAENPKITEIKLEELREND